MLANVKDQKKKIFWFDFPAFPSKPTCMFWARIFAWRPFIHSVSSWRPFKHADSLISVIQGGWKWESTYSSLFWRRDYLYLLMRCEMLAVSGRSQWPSVFAILIKASLYFVGDSWLNLLSDLVSNVQKQPQEEEPFGSGPGLGCS